MGKNCIGDLLKGHNVKAQDFASGTGLSESTCRKAMNDPYATFKESTVALMRTYYVDMFEEVALPQLFDPSNITQLGREPRTRNMLDRKSTPHEEVCKTCHLIANRLTNGVCRECQEDRTAGHPDL